MAETKKPPADCEVCHGPIENYFAVGKTYYGSSEGYQMCLPCYMLHGSQGFGPGETSLYRKQDSGQFMKV